MLSDKPVEVHHITGTREKVAYKAVTIMDCFRIVTVEERNQCGTPDEKTKVTVRLTRRVNEAFPRAFSCLLRTYRAQLANGILAWVTEIEVS